MVRVHNIDKPAAPNKGEHVAIYRTCSSLFGAAEQRQIFGMILHEVDLLWLLGNFGDSKSRLLALLKFSMP